MHNASIGCKTAPIIVNIKQTLSTIKMSRYFLQKQTTKQFKYYIVPKVFPLNLIQLIVIHNIIGKNSIHREEVSKSRHRQYQKRLFVCSRGCSAFYAALVGEQQNANLSNRNRIPGILRLVRVGITAMALCAQGITWVQIGQEHLQTALFQMITITCNLSLFQIDPYCLARVNINDVGIVVLFLIF